MTWVDEALQHGAEAERERLLDRVEALMPTMRPHCGSPRVRLWREDPRKTREKWFRLVDPQGQDPAAGAN